jgi:hypothetical protein
MSISRLQQRDSLRLTSLYIYFLASAVSNQTVNDGCAIWSATVGWP